MNEKATLEQLRAWLDLPPFHRFLRMEIESYDADAERLTLVLPFRRDYQRVPDQPQIHGGPIAALIDTAGAFLGAAVTGRGIPTVNLRIDYVRPAVDTALTAIATMRRRGSSIAVIDVDVSDEAGKLIALGRGSFAMK